MSRQDLIIDLLRLSEELPKGLPPLRPSPVSDLDFENFFLTSWRDVDLDYFVENDDALLSMLPESYCWVIPKVLIALVEFGRAVAPVRFFSDFLSWSRLSLDFASECQELNYFSEEQLNQLLDICCRIAFCAEVHQPKEYDIPLFQQEFVDFYSFLVSLKHA